MTRVRGAAQQLVAFNYCNNAKEMQTSLEYILFASQVVIVDSLSVYAKFISWFLVKTSGKVEIINTIIIVESFYVKVVGSV